MKSNSTNLGSYLGATLTSITVLFYAINLDLMMKWWVSLLSAVIIIGFGAISIKKARENSNGFIDFKTAFTNFFITTAIGVGISIVASIIIFNFIDPEAAAYLNEKILLITKESMERFGTPQEMINEAIAEASKKNNYSISSQLQGYVFALAFNSLIGLIVAAIMKKRDQSQV